MAQLRLDYTKTTCNPRSMSRSATFGCLLALNIWALACTLNPLYVNVSDRSAVLRLVTAPDELIRPWGPPLLLMALFAMLGSARKTKLIARMGAALAVYGALFWVMIGYGFSGTFAIVESDWPILLGCIAAAAILGWWGFSRDPAVAPEHQ